MIYRIPRATTMSLEPLLCYSHDEKVFYLYEIILFFMDESILHSL